MTTKTTYLQQTRQENLNKINDFNKQFKQSLKDYNEKMKGQKITLGQRQAFARELYRECFPVFKGNETLKNIITYYETLDVINKVLKDDLKSKKLDKDDPNYILNDNLRKAVLYQLKGSNDFDRLFKNLYTSFNNNVVFFQEKMKEYFNIELSDEQLTYLNLLMVNIDKERTYKDLIKIIVNIYKCSNDFQYGVKPALKTLASVEKMISIMPKKVLYHTVEINDEIVDIPRDKEIKECCDTFGIRYTEKSDTYALAKKLINKWIVLK